MNNLSDWYRGNDYDDYVEGQMQEWACKAEAILEKDWDGDMLIAAITGDKATFAKLFEKSQEPSY